MPFRKRILKIAALVVYPTLTPVDHMQELEKTQCFRNKEPTKTMTCLLVRQNVWTYVLHSLDFQEISLASLLGLRYNDVFENARLCYGEYKLPVAGKYIVGLRWVHLGKYVSEVDSS